MPHTLPPSWSEVNVPVDIGSLERWQDTHRSYTYHLQLMKYPVTRGRKIRLASSRGRVMLICIVTNPFSQKALPTGDILFQLADMTVNNLCLQDVLWYAPTWALVPRTGHPLRRCSLLCIQWASDLSTPNALIPKALKEIGKEWWRLEKEDQEFGLRAQLDVDESDVYETKDPQIPDDWSHQTNLICWGSIPSKSRPWGWTRQYG